MILVLVGQGKAGGVVHLNDGGTTARNGRCRGEEYCDLRPALENIDHKIAALHMPVKGGDEVTVPASRQVWNSDQSHFAQQAVLPEVPIKQSVERAVKTQGGGSIHPPRQGEVHDRQNLGGCPRQSDRSRREQKRNDPSFTRVRAVTVHTSPARLIRAEQAFAGLLGRAFHPQLRLESTRENIQ